MTVAKNGISKNHKHSVDLVKYIPTITAADVPIHAAATPIPFIQSPRDFLNNSVHLHRPCTLQMPFHHQFLATYL